MKGAGWESLSKLPVSKKGNVLEFIQPLISSGHIKAKYLGREGSLECFSLTSFSDIHLVFR